MEDFYSRRAELERKDLWEQILKFSQEIKYFDIPSKDVGNLDDSDKVKLGLLEDMFSLYHERYHEPFHMDHYVQDIHGQWVRNKNV